MTGQERELLLLFRRMNEDGRKRALEYAEFCYELDKHRRQTGPAEIISFTGRKQAMQTNKEKRRTAEGKTAENAAHEAHSGPEREINT